MASVLRTRGGDSSCGLAALPKFSEPRDINLVDVREGPSGSSGILRFMPHRASAGQ
jgi:hypothetical protein